MVLSNVIVDISISSRSLVFSQSDVHISAGLTNISGLAVAAFDLVNSPCLSFRSSLSLTFVSSCCKVVIGLPVSNADVVELQDPFDSFRNPFDVGYGCSSDKCRVIVTCIPPHKP